MFDIALKNLRSRKLRTALSIVAIVVAVTLFVVMNTFVVANRALFEGSTTPFEGKVAIAEHSKGNLSPMTRGIGTR
jgi:cell division protein FtsX